MVFHRAKAEGKSSSWGEQLHHVTPLGRHICFIIPNKTHNGNISMNTTIWSVTGKDCVLFWMRLRSQVTDDIQETPTQTYHYGIEDKMLAWIYAFLSNRSQSIVVDGVTINSAPLLSGVPQNNFLGPLLFLVYITDTSLFTNYTLLHCPV